MKLQKNIDNFDIMKSVFQTNSERNIEYHNKNLNYTKKIK